MQLSTEENIYPKDYEEVAWTCARKKVKEIIMSTTDEKVYEETDEYSKYSSACGEMEVDIIVY